MLEQAFTVAVAVHAGFQVTVTVLVYPALAATPPERWEVVHGAHSRRIAPLVAVLYGALVVTGGLTAYAGAVDSAWVVAVAAVGATVLLTAAVAAPLHGRLGREGPRPVLLRRLLVADRVRALLAVLALAAVLLTA